MPIMDGLEAAAEITGMDARIPIVAMTANVMSNDREVYISKGMKDIVGKPFSSQDLWRCLKRYIEPVGYQREVVSSGEKAESELRQLLINTFVANNKEKNLEILSAIESGDYELAHRLAHTLKNNAGQLGETALRRAAESMEHCLKNNENRTTSKQAETLETELKAALERLEPMVQLPDAPDSSIEPTDSAATFELFSKLEFLLNDSDFECLSLVDDLRAVIGSETLVDRVMNLDFKLALEELDKLRS